MSKGEPSHADLTHALRFAIKLAEAEGYSECAAGLRAVLAHLERTQPSDTQADLTERVSVLDSAPGDTPLRWRRHHPDLPIVAPQEDKRGD